jgi:hypothetical protein
MQNECHVPNSTSFTSSASSSYCSPCLHIGSTA